MIKTCLYCYQPLLLGETQDFHETCSKTMFGHTIIPFLDINLSEIEDLAKNMVHQQMSVTGVQKKKCLWIFKMCYLLVSQ